LDQINFDMGRHRATGDVPNPHREVTQKLTHTHLRAESRVGLTIG